MSLKAIAIVAFALFASMHCAPEGQKSSLPTPSAPVFQEKPSGQQGPSTNQQGIDIYVPHATYPYADTYPNNGYENYLMPIGNVNYPQPGEYMSSLMPSAQTALQIALRIFAKVGLFLVGGVALLVVGGVFTAAVCSLTPFCTISFAGMQNIDKNTMRSLVNPDKLSQAAEFVHDAIGKYQRLQRAIGN